MSYVPSTAARRSAWLALASATALLSTACSSDDAVGPRRAASDRPAPLSFSNAPGLPKLHSSRVKYRDRGLKPRTGRSGSAQLSVRALRGPAPAGQLGAVLLEITTGSFDSGVTPPGNLDRIYIKQRDGAGHVLSSLNFTNLENGGYAQYVLQNVIPGATLEVTANVSGIDPARTNVVTVTGRVQARPDLNASNLQAPARATRNIPVNISAVVSELNGDVGARADCVLLVDGFEVDRASWIWVDAGTSVTCAFSHAFAVEGTRQLRVLVQRVTPGDWDTGNNAVTGQITIGDLHEFYYEASAREFEARYRTDRASHGERFDRLTDALLWTQDQTDVSEINWIQHQYAEHLGFVPFELQFPLALIEMEHSTDGTLLTHMQRTAVEAQWGDSFDGPDSGFRYACAADFAEGVGVRHVYVEVCSGVDYVIRQGIRHEFPQTSFSHWRWAGEVTFFSSQFYERRFGDGTSETSVWVFNFTQQAGPVPTIPLGASYTMRFAVQGSETAARTYTSGVVVPLDQVHVPFWIEFGLSTEARWVRSTPCVDYRNDGSDFYELWRACDVLDSYEAGRSGRVSTLPVVDAP